MPDLIITGASRGIGGALARHLVDPSRRLILVARDNARLDAVAADVRARGGDAATIVGDLSSVAGARAVAAALADATAGSDDVTLVHNAGLWPQRRELGPEGLEKAFVVNAVAPVVVERALLASGRLRRVLVVSAGLLVKGHFDADKTPVGDDFGPIATYCNTKLAGAVALRALGDSAAAADVDHLIVHPGVVQTELGARSGIFGALLKLVKRSWESPERCAARLARLLALPRWREPGAPTPWYVEELASPWPDICDAVSADVLTAVGAAVGAAQDVGKKLAPSATA